MGFVHFPIFYYVANLDFFFMNRDLHAFVRNDPTTVKAVDPAD